MRRFYVEDITLESERAEITGAEFTHLKNVLRLAAGARVAVFNGRGVELAGVISSVEKSRALVEVESRTCLKGESPVRLTLIQGLVKASKPEFIVQKATELGASRIVFFAAERSVALLRPEKTATRVARWSRVAAEAAKQCGRTVVPAVEVAGTLADAVCGAGTGLKVFFWEEAAGPLGAAAAPELAQKGVAVLIGPEGGFTPSEVEAALAGGFVPASLGPRILRAETASVTALALIQYTLGDLGGDNTGKTEC